MNLIFFRHHKLHNGQIIKFKLCLFVAFSTAAYQLLYWHRIIPLLNIFLPTDIEQVLLFAKVTVFCVALFLIYLKASDIQNSQIIYFFRSLGFTNKDIFLYKAQQNLLPAFSTGLFITVTSITEFDLLLLSRYLYLPVIITVLLLFTAILPSSARFAKFAFKRRESKSFINKIAFYNKYTASLFKDILLVKRTSDFVVTFVFVALIFFAHFFYVLSFEFVLFYIALYIMIFLLSSFTCTLFIADTPCYMLIKSLTVNQKEIFVLKVFSGIFFCLVPILFFSMRQV